MNGLTATAAFQKKYSIELVSPEVLEGAVSEELGADEIDDAHIDLTKRMLRFLTDVDGAGLAAPQIGIQKQFFVFWDRRSTPYVVYNPQWYPAEGKKELWVEKCFNYDEGTYMVERYKYITGIWWEYDPETQTFEKRIKKFRGVDAQVFQHEVDLLHGRTAATTGTLVPYHTN